jgi:RNA polymerase sigma-70 factor (ECF subfamily)
LRAFELLVRRHQRAALRVAFAIAGSDADDIVQEAFVKAYRNLHRFRIGSPFRPWMMRIVANEASNARRSAGRRSSLATRSARREVATSASPEETAIAREQREAVATALAVLAPRDRLVIIYRWFAELTEAEMAVALGCRRGTVKSRLARAHERLRAELVSRSTDG